ncbi:SRPBCC domain-containing protein [Kribbella sp. NPDC004875]|uniref:SRPBCC domain-containing protein n=1 Tax=Kribbella sp. NPDC004875 TaxID=3364107 RepID=UPI0036BDFDF4
MTDRTQTHATFVLEREYPVAVGRVWAAFADPELKRQWFGSDDFIYTDRTDDFRVGGVITDDGYDGEGGPLSQFRATYTDITPNERIVYTYDMWLDGAHASTSITTVVFEPAGDSGDVGGVGGPRTRLTFTEQGVYLDGVHGPGPDAAAGRESGTAGLLDAIGKLFAAVG